MRILILFFLMLLLFPALVHGQGCAMCYSTAAAQSPQAMRAMDLGILVLLFPPVAIMLGIFWAAYRFRNYWGGQ